MRIAAVFAFPPTRDNIGAPTALPYQLLQYSPPDLEITLYYFLHAPRQQAQIDIDLAQLPLSNIVQLPFPNRVARKIDWLRAQHNGFPAGVARYSVNSKVIREINVGNFDLVWLYPHWLVEWVKWIEKSAVLVTGPDCASLHNERAIRFGNWSNITSLQAEVNLLRQNTLLEQAWGRVSARVHMVGQEDVLAFDRISKQKGQAFFVRYPLHRYMAAPQSLAEATTNKVRVLFTGGNNAIYVGDHFMRIINSLSVPATAQILAPQLEFMLIGPGYAEAVARLKAAGYSAHEHSWVQDFASETSAAHIQIFPIAVGTGTKGKVLSALATGLLGIGTLFAYENISVEPGTDCLLYQQPEEIPVLLQTVLTNKFFYADMAVSAAVKVRRDHAPELTAKMFWDAALSPLRTSG